MGVYLGKTKVSSSSARDKEVDMLLADRIENCYSETDSFCAGMFQNRSCLRSVNFPNVTEIPDNAFYNSTFLTTVTFPSAVKIGESAFKNCDWLAQVDAPNVTEIGARAFYHTGYPDAGAYGYEGAGEFKTANFPLITEVKESTFEYCNNLQTAIIPKVTTIGEYAFSNCYNLESVDCPKVTTIGEYAFNYCSNLTSVIMQNVTTIGKNAFSSCGLLSIDFPLLETISHGGFYGCDFETICFPSVTVIEGRAFDLCRNLLVADFPLVTSIDGDAFECTNYRGSVGLMTALILRNVSSLCSIVEGDDYGFELLKDHGSCYVYVPEVLLSAYKSNEHWSQYADRIRAIEDYPDICGGE